MENNSTKNYTTQDKFCIQMVAFEILISFQYAQNVEKEISDAPPQSQEMLPQTHFRQKTFEELQAQVGGTFEFHVFYHRCT